MFPALKGMKCQSSTSLLGLEGFIQGRQGSGAQAMEAEGEATVTGNIKCTLEEFPGAVASRFPSLLYFTPLL